MLIEVRENRSANDPRKVPKILGDFMARYGDDPSIADEINLTACGQVASGSTPPSEEASPLDLSPVNGAPEQRVLAPPRFVGAGWLGGLRMTLIVVGLLILLSAIVFVTRQA